MIQAVCRKGVVRKNISVISLICRLLKEAKFLVKQGSALFKRRLKKTLLVSKSCNVTLRKKAWGLAAEEEFPTEQLLPTSKGEAR